MAELDDIQAELAAAREELEKLKSPEDKSQPGSNDKRGYSQTDNILHP